ncbi:anthranilate synthase component I family protein [Flavicella sediminum]|uniref:anthranilate synthase component I family protein n=1 Tax=Flavicella sediminum TaxID=2585141 RepID=UPI001122A92A|nr:anthranilate synthase component I family protein [Flavicella sediminum]
MQRVSQSFTTKNIEQFKTQLLNWSQNFDTALWLDSNNHQQKYAEIEGVLAVEIEKKISCDHINAFEKLKKFQSSHQDYLFGFLSYDLKNDIENLTSENKDGLDFPELFFFQPKKLIFISENNVTFKYLEKYSNEIADDFKAINKTTSEITSVENKNIKLKLRIHKDAYLEKVENILSHIHRGDIYEANFCQEFYSEDSTINPVRVYDSLNKISRAPFATFLKFDNKYLLSASPERYLKKTGTTIISQPIKGTAKRASNLDEDNLLKKKLENDPKERAENIMIVDLVRNDLSRIAIKGSVKVKELCQVYSFKQVHQMISTITSEIPESIHPVDIIKNSYPMGSMTGAPKIKAMKIIEAQEETKRSLYSGAVGYFTPEGNFDFNVIIRSILYNEKNKFVSYSVGSAITSLSLPENELEECLLKAKAMREVLLSTN